MLRHGRNPCRTVYLKSAGRRCKRATGRWTGSRFNVSLVDSIPVAIAELYKITGGDFIIFAPTARPVRMITARLCTPQQIWFSIFVPLLHRVQYPLPLPDAKPGSHSMRLGYHAPFFVRPLGANRKPQKRFAPYRNNDTHQTIVLGARFHGVKVQHPPIVF